KKSRSYKKSYCSHKKKSRSYKKSCRTHKKSYRSHKKYYKKPHHHCDDYKRHDDYDSKKEYWKDGNCWVVKKKYK
ncbi:spore coat protein CotG, partial [Escherichia coli]